MSAYLQLGSAVFFNVAAYLVYRSIADAGPRIWWPIFAIGLMLGAANTFLFARSIKAIPLSVAYPVFTGASFASTPRGPYSSSMLADPSMYSATSSPSTVGS